MSDGGPAFPRPSAPEINHYGASAQEGMSLRDYFAAAALMGPIAELTGTAEEHAQIAYEYADAMLKEREPQRG